MANFWDTEQEHARVPKKGTKASYYSFKVVSKDGRDYVDVREHYTKADGTEQHTSKGISIKFQDFAEVMTAFRDMHEVLRDKL